MGKSKFIITGTLALALGLTSTGLVKAVEDVKPKDGTTVVTPKANKVSLEVEVYDGDRLIYTFVPYKDVDANTKVDLKYLKENVKLDGYTLEWQGAPLVLDKNYTVQVKAKADKPVEEGNDPAPIPTPGKKTETKTPSKATPKAGAATTHTGVKGKLGAKVGNKRLPRTSAVK